MATPDSGFEFERPIFELQNQLETLEQSANQNTDTKEEIRRVRRDLGELTKRIYGNLTPWQTVRVARHQKRPQTSNYLDLVFDEFVELHGDRCFGDDQAIRAGFAKLDQFKVIVIGHQKGRNLEERQLCRFGCANPEGYRKAIIKMRLAAKFHMPIICLIDTPGAYPGIGAEERGQAQAIAVNMYEMSQLRTPIICVVIGEGGSGGALGIGVGDRIAMLEFAYYSVISPEGCSGILWKNHEYAEQAADSLRLTSRYLKQFGVVDDVIEEPPGGAHRNHFLMASRLKSYLVKVLRELVELSADDLLTQRYDKFREMGEFLEILTTEPPDDQAAAGGHSNSPALADDGQSSGSRAPV